MEKDLNVALKTAIMHLQGRFGLEIAVLFGSQATGAVHAQSDIDIGILSKRNLSLLELAELTTQLQQSISSGKIDMVDLRTAPPILLRDVVMQGKILYEKEKDTYDHFRIYALKRFFESAPLRKMRDESLKNFTTQTV